MKYEDPADIWEDVPVCEAHRHYDADCDFCDREVSGRSKRIEKIGQEARDRVNAIVTQGGPQMPQTVILEARVEVLLDSIMIDPKDRLRYEGEVARRIMLAIQGMQAQIKQPVLHVARDVPQTIRQNHGRRR